MPEHIWRKASATVENNNCVEISVTTERALVRDSKERTGRQLRLTADGWRALLELAKEGA